ncbi:hypothetical protein ICE98_01783 [Lactococcus lactis]|nr:hypothetical protein [Lactococcus lactis]
MKTLLVLCEVKYWHDFREGLAKVGVSFLGFDKKKPNRFEIDQLVAKADFVVMRNRNVAHHSVQFAKEACKATDTPFWISSNFGLETIIKQLAQTFPDESFESTDQNKKTKSQNGKTALQKKVSLSESAKAKETQNYLKGQKKTPPPQNSAKRFQNY